MSRSCCIRMRRHLRAPTRLYWCLFRRRAIAARTLTAFTPRFEPLWRSWQRQRSREEITSIFFPAWFRRPISVTSRKSRRISRSNRFYCLITPIRWMGRRSIGITRSRRAELPSRRFVPAHPPAPRSSSGGPSQAKPRQQLFCTSGLPFHPTALGVPIGVRETDAFFEVLEQLSGRPIPAKHRQRTRKAN